MLKPYGARPMIDWDLLPVIASHADLHFLCSLSLRPHTLIPSAHRLVTAFAIVTGRGFYFRP